MFGVKNLSSEVLFLLLVVTGYTVTSAIAVPFEVENSQFFSVPYRLLVFMFSVYIIVKNFTFQKFKNTAVLAVIGFWIFYFLKSYYSFQTDFYDEIFRQNDTDVYIRIFVIAFVPSLALLFVNYKNIDFSQVAVGFLYTLLVMLSLNFAYALVMPHGKSWPFIFSLYYISYGHLGASLLLISLFFMLFLPKKVPLPIVVYGALLGCATVIIAGARSPFLAVMVVIPYLLLVKGQKKLILMFLLLLLLSIIAIYFLGRSDSFENMFIDRTYLWLFEGDTSLRTPLFQKAVNIFKENPILGGRTHFENGSYAHNIFLELLMATGIVGFMAYFLKFIPVIKNFKNFSYQVVNRYYILFFSLFLQYFVLCVTSFTLYSVPEFLYFSSIIIGISLNNINEETQSNDGGRDPSGNN